MNGTLMTSEEPCKSLSRKAMTICSISIWQKNRGGLQRCKWNEKWRSRLWTASTLSSNQLAQLKTGRAPRGSTLKVSTRKALIKAQIRWVCMTQQRGESLQRTAYIITWESLITLIVLKVFKASTAVTNITKRKAASIDLSLVRLASQAELAPPMENKTPCRWQQTKSSTGYNAHLRQE